MGPTIESSKIPKTYLCNDLGKTYVFLRFSGVQGLPGSFWRPKKAPKRLSQATLGNSEPFSDHLGNKCLQDSCGFRCLCWCPVQFWGLLWA